MTILHARSEPQFTEHLRRVLAEANETPHSADVAAGYFYLSGFDRVAEPPASDEVTTGHHEFRERA